MFACFRFSTGIEEEASAGGRVYFGVCGELRGGGGWAIMYGQQVCDLFENGCRLLQQNICCEWCCLSEHGAWYCTGLSERGKYSGSKVCVKFGCVPFSRLGQGVTQMQQQLLLLLERVSMGLRLSTQHPTGLP